jgi:hypothetical protein
LFDELLAERGEPAAAALAPLPDGFLAPGMPGPRRPSAGLGVDELGTVDAEAVPVLPALTDDLDAPGPVGGLHRTDDDLHDGDGTTSAPSPRQPSGQDTEPEPRWVLKFMPAYLFGDGIGFVPDDAECWDLQLEEDWLAGRPHQGGEWSADGTRDADPATLAAWASERLGYPVTLVADAPQQIGWPYDVATGQVSKWNAEPLYLVQPVAPR